MDYWWLLVPYVPAAYTVAYLGIWAFAKWKDIGRAATNSKRIGIGYDDQEMLSFFLVLAPITIPILLLFVVVAAVFLPIGLLLEKICVWVQEHVLFREEHRSSD